MWLKIAKNPITKKKNIADKIIHYCLYLIVFLLPLIFFPNTDTMLEFPKLLVFGILIIVAAAAWLAGVMIEKKVVYKQGLLNMFVLAFGFLYLLATLFSVDRFNSFLGNSLSHGSLISVLLGIVLYFLMVNSIRDIKEVWELLRGFLFSGLLVLIFNLAQLFGVHVFSYDFTQNNAFNLIANSVSIFAIYLVTLSVFAFGFLVKSEKRIDRVLSEVVIILAFATLFFLDSSLGWYLLIAGMFLWLVFLSMQSKKLRTIWIIIPTILLVIAIGFLFFNTASISAVVPPQDVKLDLQTAWNITKSGGMQMFLFGSGPETFLYDFTKYRPVEFNNSLLWQLRFDRSYNELFQLFATVGFFATALFVGLFLWSIVKIGRRVLSAKQPDDAWIYLATVTVAFLVLFLSVFLHHFSSITYLLFWLLLGMCGNIVLTKTKKIDFQKSPQSNFAFSILFALLLVGSVSFIYFGTRLLVSENNYTKAEKIANDTSKSVAVSQYLEKSVEQAPWNAQYHLSLAEQYVVASSLDENSAKSAQFLADAKSAVDYAVKKASKNTVIIERAAEIYRVINNLNGPVSVADVFDTYANAIALDPNNAYLIYNVANVYYASAQTLEQSETITPEIEEEINNLLSSAEQNARKAIDLRENYWEANLIFAKILKMQEKTQEAADILTGSISLNPYNLALREELGKDLIDLNELDKAKEQFQIIISLQPDHANAHFWLAVVYEAKGEKENAISELEKVLATNPDNEMILNKISTLKGE
ncbi:MAG: tetratricopeptide repeat protein [Patescibacteria group bacterium]